MDLRENEPILLKSVSILDCRSADTGIKIHQ